ncbi:MAG: hypothetical protein ACLP50_01360 [Solirubrobacteraceae bacterium]
MFQASVRRLKALLSLADDLLGDPEPVARHPHRRPLRLEHERRPGTVPPPPAHCLSPVRGHSDGRRLDRVR